MSEMDEEEEIPVEELRRLVHEAVQATSLRAMQAETGISKTGLHKFLMGSTPFRRTRAQLQGWYLARRRAEPGPASPGAQTALRALTGHLPARAQGAVRDEIAALVARETLIHGAELPAWLRGEGESG